MCSCSKVALLLIGVTIVRTGAERREWIAETASEQNTDSTTMNKQETSLVRRIIYSHGAIIGHSTEDGHTEVVPDEEIAELHGRKRISTLALLLEIVRGGVGPLTQSMPAQPQSHWKGACAGVVTMELSSRERVRIDWMKSDQNPSPRCARV
jgi:hypothetical protein